MTMGVKVLSVLVAMVPLVMLCQSAPLDDIQAAFSDLKDDITQLKAREEARISAKTPVDDFLASLKNATLGLLAGLASKIPGKNLVQEAGSQRVLARTPIDDFLASMKNATLGLLSSVIGSLPVKNLAPEASSQRVLARTPVDDFLASMKNATLGLLSSVIGSLPVKNLAQEAGSQRVLARTPIDDFLASMKNATLGLLSSVIGSLPVKNIAVEAGSQQDRSSSQLDDILLEAMVDDTFDTIADSVRSDFTKEAEAEKSDWSPFALRGARTNEDEMELMKAEKHAEKLEGYAELYDMLKGLLKKLEKQ